MTQNRDLRATVGYKVDQQSVAAAKSANEKVALSFDGVQVSANAISAEFLKLNPQLAALVAQEQAAAASTQRLSQTQTVAASSASRLTSSLNGQKAPVQDLTNLYKSLEDQARRAGAAQDVAANSGKSAGGFAGTGIASGFGTVRSLAGAAGLVAGNSQAGSTIAAFAGLASVLGPVGIGIAALGVGLRLITDESERAAKAIEDSATALTKAREAALKSTRNDLEQQLRDAQALEQVRKRAFDDAANALIDFVKENPTFTFPVTGIALEWVSGMGGQLGGLQANAQNAEKALKATQNEIAGLTAVLEENGAAAFTATQAALAQADRALSIDRMTREEREERIAQIERDINLLAEQAIAAGKTTDAGIALTAQIDALKEELQQITGVTSTYADALEAEKAAKDALVDASDAINDGLKDIAAAAQDVAEAQKRIADIRQQLVDIDAEAAEKSRLLALETAEREREAQADAEERRAEIIADGAERRQEIELDDAERRAEILKRFNTDYFNAIASRDALAAFKAKQTRDDELDKQQKAYRKQLDQLEKQMDKQLAAVDKALDKQLRNIQKQYERQQASIDDAYNKQLRNLTKALNEALAAEQFANNRLEALRSENAFRAQYWAGVVEVANKRYGDSAAALAVSLHQSAALIEGVNTRRGSGGGGSIPGMAGGGLVTAAFGMTDPGARIGGASGAMRGGMNRMPVNISSASSRSTVIHFAPVINGARMSMPQFERLADRWYRDFNRMVR